MNNSDENISIADLINNLKDKLGNQSLDNETTPSDNIDISSIFKKISQNQTNNESEDNNESFNSTIPPNFDLSSMLGNLARSDPRKDLLLSLKPFLKKTRQDKLDTYISLLSISNILNLSNFFTAESSDKNVK